MKLRSTPRWARKEPVQALAWGDSSGVAELGGIASPAGASRWPAPPRCVPQRCHPGTAPTGSRSNPHLCLARIIHTVKPSPRDPPDSVVSVGNNPRCWIAGEYSTGATQGLSEISGCGECPVPTRRERIRLSSSFPPSWDGLASFRRRNRTSNFLGTFGNFLGPTSESRLARRRRPLEAPSIQERRQKARLSPCQANFFRGASRGRGQSRLRSRGR